VAAVILLVQHQVKVIVADHLLDQMVEAVAEAELVL
jgi:hypothetical protein